MGTRTGSKNHRSPEATSKGMSVKRFALFGAGFWAPFQLAAWSEINGANCVAIYNRSESSARRLAGRFAIPAVYTDPERLLTNEDLDFVDIVTSPDSHAGLALVAGRHGKAVICQKPMTPSLPASIDLVRQMGALGAPFFVHENFRWQRPMREVAAALIEGVIGQPFRAHLDFSTGYPVFENQPAVAQMSELIIADLGVHLLDIARFLFGEATSIYCVTQRVNPTIVGEDVATIVLRMARGATVTITISFSSVPARDPFPETLVRIEGEEGSIDLAPDYQLRVTRRDGMTTRSVAPRVYDWADPAYAVVHASIVDCNRNLLDAINGVDRAETSAVDNLKTLRLVASAYDSAATNRTVAVLPGD
jgi:predicted dehydrogenase